jgi:hypothetical protein
LAALRRLPALRLGALRRDIALRFGALRVVAFRAFLGAFREGLAALRAGALAAGGVDQRG